MLSELKLRETLESSGLFDRDWYARSFPDVALSGLDPTDHYLRFGLLVGRPPSSVGQMRPLATLKSSPRFCVEAYRLANPQVPKHPQAALLHRLLHSSEQNLVTNWLDFTLDNLCGNSHRVRINSLLDLLLREDEHEANDSSRAAQLCRMTDRLSLALRARPAPGATPKASIVVAVYNQVFHTLACAISLFESLPNTSFELIIANDCSTDETLETLSYFAPWIRVVTTAGTLGFLRNCNHAAKTATGEFIVMLNNDMILLPGWLDEMVRTLEAHPTCGMVGSKLLSLDGSLQEAGGIIWQDGSAWNYGRGKDQRAPEFNYVREADYCSGASLCLRRKLWDELSGFNESYAPAYCEDSDLSFRLRSHGLSTLYQPKSVAIHLEGVSCGTDTATGVKSYQVTNQRKLIEQWGHVLREDHFPNAENVFLARGRTRGRKCVMVIDHYIPQPDRDAGSRTMTHIIETLIARGYQVVLWPDNLHYDKPYADIFQQMGALVLYGGEFVSDFSTWLSDHARYLDGFLLSRPHVAPKYIQAIRSHSQAPIAYYGHDVHHVRLKRQLAAAPDDREVARSAAEYEEMEKHVWNSVDVIYYPSQLEVDYVASHRDPHPSHKQVRVLTPWAFKSFPTDAHTNLAVRAGLLFVGGFGHPPNVEAVLWFSEKIWPALKKRFPSLTLAIAGSNPPPEVVGLAARGISIKGFVTDSELEQLYRSARVSIVPLLHGAGVKGKVVEAMRFGLPVVTTSVGAEGIPDAHLALRVADSPQEMIEAIASLVCDDDLWRECSDASARLARAHYSPEAMWSALADVF